MHSVIIGAISRQWLDCIKHSKSSICLDLILSFPKVCRWTMCKYSSSPLTLGTSTSKMVLGHQPWYLFHVEQWCGRAAAKGGGLSSPWWEGFKLPGYMGFPLYMLSRLPCGGGPLQTDTLFRLGLAGIQSRGQLVCFSILCIFAKE